MLPKEYIFIEPHPDDMILSSGFLFFKHKPKKVITIFTSDKNHDTGTTQICKKYGIKHFSFRFPDIDIKLKARLFPTNKLVKALSKVIKPKDSIVSVLGFGHAAHEFLRDTLISNFENKMIFARDFPHSYKKYSNFNRAEIRFYKLFELEGDFQQKINIFIKYYKSQKGLLWFDKKFFEMEPVEEYYKPKTKWFWI